MKITIPRSELKTAVTGLGRIIPAKVTLPILGCVRFDCDPEGIVTATATDLDQTAVYRFTGPGEGTGTFVLSLPPLKELTKGAGSDTVEFTLADGQVNVTHQVGGHQIQFTVIPMDKDEWPEIDRAIPTRPAEGFLDTYRRLLPFASTDETRYAINSVFIDVEGKGERPVCMVSVDGRRLSVWNSMRFDLDHSVVVPLSRFLAWTGLEGEAAIGVIRDKAIKGAGQGREWFGVDIGAWRYFVRVPEVNFPNWRQVVPNYVENVRCCRFTDADVEALRKILPTFPGHDSREERITLIGQGGRLSIAGRNEDADRDTVLTLEGGTTHEGTDGRIALNRSYLLDALAAGFRTFSYTDELTPLKGEDGKGGTHVLMPVRLSQEPTNVQTKQQPATPAVAKENEMTEKKDEMSALDRVLVAVETAKGKMREAASSLAEVGDAIKVAVREGKTQSADLEKARATLQKLQAISL